MKSKLVFWGVNSEEKRVLIAMQLRALENKVDLFTFPGDGVTEEFVQQLRNDWRDGKEVAFPEGHVHIVRELSVTEGLLPDDLKVDRSDVVQRAQAEWHFTVLSTKLNQAYRSELDELKDRVDKLDSYDADAWEALKSFWAKVQTQVRERNLFREHGNDLRDNINSLFNQMKAMRSSMNEEFRKGSQEVMDKFSAGLDSVDEKINSGAAFKAVFEELKGIQRDFKGAKLTKEHRNKLWNRIDNSFKKVKEIRFGKEEPKSKSGNAALDRLQRRLKGLEDVIRKMENSIRRDQEDLDFQNDRINTTDGQLEAQIRKAKMKMIEERFASKKEKYDGMLETRKSLTEKIAQLEAKEAERRIKEEARAAAKAKIADEVEANKAEMEERKKELELASQKITNEKGKKKSNDESMLNVIGSMLGESFEDVVDTVRAISEVVEDKLEDAIDNFKDSMSDAAAKTEAKPVAVVATKASAQKEEE